MPISPATIVIGNSPVSIIGNPRRSPPTLDFQYGSGWSADVTFQVAVADCYAFCQFLAGDLYSISLGGGVTVNRYIPCSHPDFANLLCLGLKTVHKGGYSGSGTPTLYQYTWSEVTASFQSVPYPTDGSTAFYTVETVGGSESYSVAGGKLKFPSDNTPLQVDATVPVPVIQYRVTVYLCYSLNDSVLNPLAGSVNNNTFLGWPAGTIRFDNYTSSLAMTATNTATYTRTLNLSYRAIPWNQLLRPNYVWEAPTAPSGAYLYTAADLSPLLQ